VIEATEARYASRALQQDEEEQAVSTASRNLVHPYVLWNKDMRQRLYPNGIIPDLVIIGTSKASCALLKHVYKDKKVFGTVVLPEVSMHGNTAAGSIHDKSCLVYTLDEQGKIMITTCQYNVPAERALAVAKGMLSEICPKHVLVLGSMSSEQMRGGQGDPSQEALLYVLRTAASRSSSRQQLQLPHLPTGTLVSGLPAALMTYCQVHCMSAEAVMTVDMVPSLAALSLQPLAETLAAAVGSVSSLSTPVPGIRLQDVQSAAKDCMTGVASLGVASVYS